jgi:hypothetical protein
MRHWSCCLAGGDDADLPKPVENLCVLEKSGGGEWNGVDRRDSGASDGDRVNAKAVETGDQ